MFDFFNTSDVTSLLLCGALDRVARRCIREQVLERTLQKCFHTLFTNIKNAFVSPVLGTSAWKFENYHTDRSHT